MYISLSMCPSLTILWNSLRCSGMRSWWVGIGLLLEPKQVLLLQFRQYLPDLPVVSLTWSSDPAQCLGSLAGVIFELADCSRLNTVSGTYASWYLTYQSHFFWGKGCGACGSAVLSAFWTDPSAAFFLWGKAPCWFSGSLPNSPDRGYPGPRFPATIAILGSASWGQWVSLAHSTSWTSWQKEHVGCMLQRSIQSVLDGCCNVASRASWKLLETDGPK